MSGTTSKEGIVVCVDGSAGSDAAVAWATREAGLSLWWSVAMAVKGLPACFWGRSVLLSLNQQRSQ